MAAFDFLAITAAQAAAYSPADNLVIGGPASLTSVAYLTAPDRAAVTVGSTTVEFGAGIFGDLDLTYAAGGRLFIGGAAAEADGGSGSDDAMFGGQGADTLSGGDGSDLLQGNQGADSLAGGAGNDSIYGGQDGDLIVLGSGAGERNWTNGNRGEDTITASDGIDTVLGGQGNDLITGGAGGDFLNGNLGDDTVRGGVGADSIHGEGGADRLSGGGGADVFFFAANTTGTAEGTADRIVDWAADDRLSAPVSVSVFGYMEIEPTPAYRDYYGVLYGGTTYDFASGLQAANSGMAMQPELRAIAVQTTTDVVVYLDSNDDHMADMAVVLAGANLSTIDAVSFI